MNPHHTVILSELKKHQGRGSQHSDKDNYLLSGHAYYNISVPIRRMLMKEWFKKNSALTNDELIALVDSLYQGKSHEEKSAASMILSHNESLRKKVTTRQLNSWFEHLVGWAEIDSICQNTFTAEEMLNSWKEWSAFIRALSKDKNINKRRASLVLLTGPVHYSNDVRIIDLSFEMIQALKHEKEIIITKAISWLLRSAVTRHKEKVRAFLKAESMTLPKIAVRETTRKIETGKK